MAFKIACISRKFVKISYVWVLCNNNGSDNDNNNDKNTLIMILVRQILTVMMKKVYDNNNSSIIIMIKMIMTITLVFVNITKGAWRIC